MCSSSLRRRAIAFVAVALTCVAPLSGVCQGRHDKEVGDAHLSYNVFTVDASGTKRIRKPCETLQPNIFFYNTPIIALIMPKPFVSKPLINKNGRTDAKVGLQLYGTTTIWLDDATDWALPIDMSEVEGPETLSYWMTMDQGAGKTSDSSGVGSWTHRVGADATVQFDIDAVKYGPHPWTVAGYFARVDYFRWDAVMGMGKSGKPGKMGGLVHFTDVDDPTPLPKEWSGLGLELRNQARELKKALEDARHRAYGDNLAPRDEKKIRKILHDTKVIAEKILPDIDYDDRPAKTTQQEERDDSPITIKRDKRNKNKYLITALRDVSVHREANNGKYKGASTSLKKGEELIAYVRREGEYVVAEEEGEEISYYEWNGTRR